MDEFLGFIQENYSKELKLVIALSKENPDKTEVEELLRDNDWSAFLELCQKHRLISHIHKQLHLLNGFITPEITERIKQGKLDQSGRALGFMASLLNLHEQLREQDILHCFFKGSLLSIELYNDVGFREFRDIDILVDLENVEKTKQVIEELGFVSIYPPSNLTDKQRRVNYTISHHYHFKNRKSNIDIELHWNISNPKSFFGKETRDILSNVSFMMVSNTRAPYISRIDNLVFLAAHGAVHQWYRLFWLKDFSVLLLKSSSDELIKAFEQARILKLDNCFYQACMLASLIYKSSFPDFLDFVPKKEYLISVPLHSILYNDLSQKGLSGKLSSVAYRIKLKPYIKYYFDIIYRLRTHLKDWEVIKISDRFFFLYYFLRPFLLIYRFLFKAG